MLLAGRRGSLPPFFLFLPFPHLLLPPSQKWRGSRRGSMAQPKVGGFSPGNPIVGSAAGGVCGINHVSRATRKTKCSTLITYNVITRGNDVQNSGGTCKTTHFAQLVSCARRILVLNRREYGYPWSPPTRASSLTWEGIQVRHTQWTTFNR
jgi:hypothetical protein